MTLLSSIFNWPRKSLWTFGSEPTTTVKIPPTIRELRKEKNRKLLFGLEAKIAHEKRVAERAKYVAYGYLRGKPYYKIENKPWWKRPPYSKEPPHWDLVADLIIKQSNKYMNKEIIKSKLRVWAGN